MTKIVIKRNGEKEIFDSEKISKVLSAAGLEQPQLDQVIKNMTDWINTLPEQETPSTKIRDQIITELEKANPYIAGLYRWYQKTKDYSIQV